MLGVTSNPYRCLQDIGRGRHCRSLVIHNCIIYSCLKSAGVVLYYTPSQAAICCFCHEAVLFWKICFPFSAKQFETTWGFKYMHAATGIVVFLLPLLPIIAHFVTGGSNSAFRHPPILCLGFNRDISFYGVALPISLLM